MENTVSDTNNLIPNEAENINLNEAAPAVAAAENTNAARDQSCSSERDECDNVISSTTPDKFVEQLNPSTTTLASLEDSNLNSETDTDFFASELSMSGVPTEKITENVEDIVQDLENLLGESNDGYRFSRDSFDNSKVAESYDEVNSSNVEDLVQQADLFQIESNAENTNLNSTVKCDMLPDDNVMTSSDNQLNISIVSPEIASATEVSTVNIINELESMKTDESVNTLNLIESTDKPVESNNINEELKDIVQESTSMEILQPPQMSCEQPESIAEQTSETESNVSKTGISETMETDISESKESCANKTTITESDTVVSQTLESCDVVPEESTEPPVSISEVSDASVNVSQTVETSANVSEIADDVDISQTVESSASVSETTDSSVDVSQTPVSISEITESCVDVPKTFETGVDLKTIDLSNVDSDKSSVTDKLIKKTEDVSSSNVLSTTETSEAVGIKEAVVASEVRIEVDDEITSVIDYQESNIETSNQNIIADINIFDNKEVSTNLEELEIPTSLDETLEACDGTSQENVTELIQELVEGTAIASDDNICAEASNNDEIVYAFNEPNRQEIIAPDVQPKLAAETEAMQIDQVEGNIELSIAEVSQSTEQQASEAVEEHILEITTNVCDQSKSILGASIPDDAPIKENMESSQTVADESPTSTNIGQPLTVEVEDPSVDEQFPAEVDTYDITEESEKMESDAVEINTSGDTTPENTKEQVNRAPLKMTIAKQSENVHSILKIYDPNEPPPSQEQQIPKLIIKSSNDQEFSISEEQVIPKITIKPVLTPPETQHSPKLTIKPIKPPQEESKVSKCVSSTSTGSPRITIKPVVKPEALSPLKLTLRPFPKIEDVPSSPKLNIKPIIKPAEESFIESHHSPKITIKPIVKPPEEIQSYTEERHSPRITIKPVVKPLDECVKIESENVSSPRITIKPIIKPPDEPEQSDDVPSMQQPFKLNIKPVVRPAESSLSPKITIKPVQKPPEIENESIELIDFEEQIKQERIVLKIAKNTKKERIPAENEKLKKIKVKFSKEGGTAHIVSSHKRASLEGNEPESKYFKAETSDLTISLVPPSGAPATTTTTSDITITRVDNTIESKQEQNLHAPVTIESLPPTNVSSTVNTEEIPDPLADIPVFEITLETAASLTSTQTKLTTTTAPVAAPPAPRKRGRPRKVPLEVREEFKDPKEEETQQLSATEESSRPKRSCRGASVRATLGIKPRKPRAPSTRGRGRGRGGGRGPGRKSKERKGTVGRPRLIKEPMLKESEFKEFEANKDVEFKQVPLPATESANQEVVIYEEETRMSAENSSRAQTPAKQVLTSSTEVIEESQSSVQSNTTTESGEKIQKARKGPRLEVHQEPEGEVISADKLAEYSWGGGGPYMLQEQVAQFLGIKSFKRKYPGIQRRPVDMQERDFIRESCLASEAMCDMGLTAVKSEDILDIMYTDFQHKYEEYCKHQRDRQAKDVSNKQKALSLAASQEKNKLDIVEQAVQSASQWNANFNKARREQRRACMDLQTFTVHFPKGRMKQVNKPPVGNYPLALVPGQFTDYYKKYNPYELSRLPLNTIGCKNITISHDTEESQSDASGSDSDSSSSDSDSSCSGSSGIEDCKMCRPTGTANKKLLVH